MNIDKTAQDGYNRTTSLLLEALELCDCGNRRALGRLLGHDGVRKSRFKPDEKWTASVGGLIFTLHPANSHRTFGDKKRFHRLEIFCPCCGLSIPVGRLHQHASIHINARLSSRESVFVGRGRSVWYQNWYVDDRGEFRRVDRSALQYSFPSKPAGF